MFSFILFLRHNNKRLIERKKENPVQVLRSKTYLILSLFPEKVPASCRSTSNQHLKAATELFRRGGKIATQFLSLFPSTCTEQQNGV